MAEDLHSAVMATIAFVKAQVARILEADEVAADGEVADIAKDIHASMAALEAHAAAAKAAEPVPGAVPAPTPAAPTPTDPAVKPTDPPANPAR